MLITSSPTRFNYSQLAGITISVAIVAAGAVGIISAGGDFLLHSALIGAIIAGTAAATITTAIHISQIRQPGQPHAFPLDVAERLAAVETSLATQHKRGDRLEVVINNAGKDLVNARAEIHDMKGFLRTIMDGIRGIVVKMPSPHAPDPKEEPGQRSISRSDTPSGGHPIHHP